MSDNTEPDVSTALELLRAAVEEANDASAAVSTGTDLALLHEDAVAVKQRFAAAHAQVKKAQQQVVAAQKRAKEEIEQQKRALDEMVRKINADLAPLEEQAARLRDGIAALNLYLGRDEWIETLRTGTPAPATEPLHIRQTVLAMDEEAALVDLKYGGIDFNSIDKFDEWILSDPIHLNQVLPEQRGVVAIVPRRSSISYSKDPWENDSKNNANRETWWLIRNGENLYRIVIDDFSVGSRLIPRADEFTSMFLESDGHGGKKSIQPGSSQWLQAEKHADVKTRHYMKIALVLQGLVARTAIFHPLPVPDLNLLEQTHYDEGFVRLIADDELSLDMGHPPFDRWLRAINENIRVGVRIIGDFGTYYSRTSRSSSTDRPRKHPEYASGPDKLVVHTLNRESTQGEFTFAYDRTDEVWDERRMRYRAPRARASFRIQPGDGDFIAIDFVNRDEIRYYLDSRSERRHYLSSFPLLRATLEFLDKEAAEEAPFRALLEAELTKLDGADSVDDLIRWWKVANKWNRALNGEPEAEAKAARVIIAEAKRRIRAAANVDAETTLIGKVLADHHNIIAIGRRTTDWVAVQAIRRPWSHENDEGNRFKHTTVPGNVYVNLLTVNAASNVTNIREWQTVSRAQTAKWALIHETPEWAKWDIGARAKDHITDPQIQEVINHVLARAAERGFTPLAMQAEAYTESTTILGGDLYGVKAGHTNKEPEFGLELTGDAPHSFTTERLSFWVSRETGKITVQERSFRNGDSWRSGWSNEVKPPWTGHSHENQIVWEDATAIAAVHEAAVKWEVADKRRRGIQGERDRLINGISAAWVAREYDRAFARFMEDYGDADLWEDHKKTITIRSPYTSATRRSNSTGWKTLTAAVTERVQDRVDLSGLTVAEAFGAASAGFDDDVAELRFPEREKES